MTKIKDFISNIQMAYEEFIWKASDENRELVKQRLDQHAQSMVDSSKKSPYFDFKD